MRRKGQRLGEHGSVESRFSQRNCRRRIAAQLDLETAERSGGSRSTGKMDRATRPTIQRPHLADYVGNRVRVRTAQRVAPNSAGRWFAGGDRARSSTDIRYAQHQKGGRARHLARQSVDIIEPQFAPRLQHHIERTRENYPHNRSNPVKNENSHPRYRGRIRIGDLLKTTNVRLNHAMQHTFTKSDLAKIIQFPVRCHSAGCGTVSQTQSATQLTTRSFTAVHIGPWFAFTMTLAT
jgi:hypothetical protein